MEHLKKFKNFSEDLVREKYKDADDFVVYFKTLLKDVEGLTIWDDTDDDDQVFLWVQGKKEEEPLVTLKKNGSLIWNNGGHNMTVVELKKLVRTLIK